MLTIKPWDKSQIKAIEKALVQSPLGLTPQNDGDIIRVDGNAGVVEVLQRAAVAAEPAVAGPVVPGLDAAPA